MSSSLVFSLDASSLSRTWPLPDFVVLLESDFFVSFFRSCWYTRYETQKRMAFFYLTSMVISGFSNIIGYGSEWDRHRSCFRLGADFLAVSLLNGRGGLEGWRWIFALFGGTF